jgi:hypothetical protein
VEDYLQMQPLVVQVEVRLELATLLVLMVLLVKEIKVVMAEEPGNHLEVHLQFMLAEAEVVQTLLVLMVFLIHQVVMAVMEPLTPIQVLL